MHDALILENLELPSVLLCTTNFTHTARVLAEQLGRGGYPIVEIDHPIGRLDDSGLADRVSQAVDKAVELLM
ncbi:MAG: hypothetical protein F4207_07755 [Gemmatimonadetes bacterium]|nr:hypothetical protein [Gemmatimonadota bacterium]MYA78226.1 hypothetical protein [Gemmatimonadota bacterium]MYG16306.1 hypothetical protein [Gemmatimonadota bacterium]MYH17706.1 hypothetical protein [Gemmatimonadota bacterium]MYK97817.1 hypothetical protein [Gemmatimonadota bacterium]